MLRLVPLLALVVVLSACREIVTEADQAPPPVVATVQREAPFEMGVGSLALFGPDSLGLRFVGPISDNRCPADVQCVTPGFVRLQMHLERPGEIVDTFILTLPGLVPTPYTDGPFVAAGGYTIQLLRVTPYPVQDETIDRDTYRALLVIR